MKNKRAFGATIALLVWGMPSSAETVLVKYRGPLDLAPLRCERITRSSLIQRLCFDAGNQYVVVNLNGTYYHYCGVPAEIVSEWRGADSMGRYFNGMIKGQFDCRLTPPPSYR